MSAVAGLFAGRMLSLAPMEHQMPSRKVALTTLATFKQSVPFLLAFAYFQFQIQVCLLATMLTLAFPMSLSLYIQLTASVAEKEHFSLYGSEL